MLNKLLMFLMVFLFSASIVSSEISFDGQKLNRGIKEEIAQTGINVPEPLSSEDKSFWDWFFNKPDSKIKEWTIMVFINAKNNLERFGLKDVNEMEAVGSSDKVNIVVEIGRMDGFDSSDGDWKGTRRYLVKKDNDTSKITSPVVEDLGKTDMGDWQSVAAFGKWAKAKYPAKKYMIVIWNHGSGWEKNIRGLITKGISYDDETGTHLTTPQLGMALRDMDGVDVYGSDACLMGMAEVVYEIKDYAKFIVGSEETEPGDGYTYDALLSPLIAGPAMTPEQFAKVAVDAYSDHYQSIGEGSTQSYVKSAAINGFLKVVNEFTYSASNAGEKELVKKAVGNAQSYAISDNKDLYHFVSLILKETKNADVTAKGNALMDFINKELVGHNRYTNGSGGWWGPVDYSNSHGIAVYLPGYSFNDGYNELQWAQYSNWDEFVKWYQEKDKVSQTAQNYLIKNSDKGWVDWVIGACISWVVEKICDTVWDAAKQKYVEVCKEAKTCTQYEYKPSSDDAQITPDEQYEIDNNLQRINVK